MLTRPSTLSPSKYPLFYGLILCLLVSYSTASYYEEFYEDRPIQEYSIEPNSKNFKIDLDYPQAFQVNIIAFNGSETEASFCKTYPSKIVSQVEWNGPISSTSGSYDNIEFYKDYYFILESLSFNIIAVQDFTDSPSNIIIDSEFQNEDKDKAFFVLDPEDGFLFVITRKHLFSYSLNDFFNAVKENKAIPKLKYEAPNFRGYETILSIRYYKHRLYIVADNVVEVFVINNEGEVTPQIKFDAGFFQESGEVSITDIALKGNYAYVLDKIKGIYVVDVSNADLPDHTNVTDKYKFQPNDTESLSQGQLIEVIGDSLQVISDGNDLFEFIIRGDQKLMFNRRSQLSQLVQATFADSNFLYLLNASSNMVAKHSIPESYKTKDVEDSLVGYWSLLGAKALVSRTVNQTSRAAVLYKDSVAIIVFKESNPYISCNNTGMLKGLYSYKLQAIQKDCPAKINAAANNTEIDYHTVCIINQELRLSITQDSVSLLESKQTNFSLYIGAAVVTFIIILSICLLIKYRNQKNRLFKFRQFENENTDQNVISKDVKDKKSVVSSQQEEIDPYSINIMAELKKYEEQHNSKVELEDIKPLDIEGIYGRSSKVNNDDDSSIESELK